MNLTPVQQDLIVAAWATSRDGNGIAIEPWAIPDADGLAEAGWLERRWFTNPDGHREIAWFWTRAAELALDVNALMSSTEGREN